MDNPFAHNNITTASTKEKSMSNTDTSNSKFVATYKGGTGFDAPWLVHHADSLDEIKETLENELLRDIFDLMQAAGGYFASKGTPAPAGGGRAPRQGQPSGSTSIELSDKDWNKIEDRFGSREIPSGWETRSGVAKNSGKPWRAVMPPRGSDEKPLFL